MGQAVLPVLGEPAGLGALPVVGARAARVVEPVEPVAPAAQGAAIPTTSDLLPVAVAAQVVRDLAVAMVDPEGAAGRHMHSVTS